VQTLPLRASPEELALHERVLAGDTTAPAEVFERFLGPVSRPLLGSRSPGPDTHTIEDAVTDALASYVQRPAQYDPARRGLHSYLLMSARGDLQNALTTERRRAARSVEIDDARPAVEDSLTVRNRSAEDEFLEQLGVELPGGLSRSEALRMIAEEFPDPLDRRLLALILDGVRETSAYVPLLGLAGRPRDEQRHEVKRNKDRLEKRLQRLRARVKRAGTGGESVPSASAGVAGPGAGDRCDGGPL
jgi:hypothetical protein